MKKELYILSGLGADERVFQRLHVSGFDTTFIRWIPPRENETIEGYATRLLEQIKTTKPLLIGVSFGGMIAIEIAKQIETEKVILIASAKTKNEIPFYYRFAGQLGMHKLLPTKLLKRSNYITNLLFGADSATDKQVLKQILAETDPIFLEWALDKIVKWKNKVLIHNVFHIHGTSDKVLPLVFVNCDVSIKKGGHLMTLNKADALNRIIRRQLE